MSNKFSLSTVAFFRFPRLVNVAILHRATFTHIVSSFSQVSKNLAVGDGVRIVSDPEKLPSSIVINGQVITDMDTPLSGDCEEAKEFIIIRDMHIAAVEERFIDAAKLRDELQQFRAQSSSKQKQT
jgi:hypothetical protein